MLNCMSWIVYRHITPSGKSYIGITSRKNPNKRWRNGKGYEKGSAFRRAIDKYGWDDIQHNILFNDLTEKEAKWLENYLICYYWTFVGFKNSKGYNMTLGGEGSTGCKHTNEAKRKISEACKGIEHSNKGKPQTDEAKKKNSEAHKGKTPWNKGKTGVQVAWNKGKTGVQVAWNKGKKIGHPSEESRRKNSESNKGKTPSEESRRKNSESHKGKHRVYHEDGTFHMER